MDLIATLLILRYGTSFIEQVSLNHISPWLGGGDPVEANGSANGAAAQIQVIGLIVLSLKYSKFISYIVWSLHFYEEKQSFK